MIGNNCLLDTSIVIKAFKQDKTITLRLDSFSGVYLTTIVAGELHFGAYASTDPARHLKQINEFLENCIMIYPDNDTADSYGKIKAALKKKGKPIPENDIWIAAVAIQHNIPLYTTDNHFLEIEGLILK